MHLGMAPMSSLEVWIEGMLVVHYRERPRCHPLGKELRSGRPRDEVAEHPSHTSKAWWDGGEDFLEASEPRPPKLVGIAVDDPVRVELSRGLPRHARHGVDLRHDVG